MTEDEFNSWLRSCPGKYQEEWADEGLSCIVFVFTPSEEVEEN